MLSSTGKIPVWIVGNGQERKISIRVRIMNEYGKFRRADLEPHFPLRLGARILQPIPHGVILGDSTRGSIEECGRGEINLSLNARDSVFTMPMQTACPAIAIEVFVQGPARSRVLSVLTPTIRITSSSIEDVSGAPTERRKC